VKKNILLSILAILLSWCTSKQALNSPASLEETIRSAARQMELKLSADIKIAIISVGSSSQQLSEYIINQLETALVKNGKLIVVDRANLDKIREEQGFQLSGYVSDESAKAIGQHLGAGAIVTGSFIDLGEAYHLMLKAINMQTAAIAVSHSADVAKSVRIETMLAAGGGAGGAHRTIVPEKKEAIDDKPNKTYKIGDKGPAGGWIFFDMGFYMDGWRYLEAAPQDFPSKVEWGSYNSALRTEAGTGKQNTAILLSSLNRNGETLRAAQVVNVPKYGGYDDWFLPSKDELNLMYQNLQNRGIGEFSNESYWSSSYNSGMYSGPYYKNFSNGQEGSNWYVNGRYSLLVRGIRRF
jgi:hypothetical protein